VTDAVRSKTIWTVRLQFPTIPFDRHFQETKFHSSR
jgi:hypothetical protein